MVSMSLVDERPIIRAVISNPLVSKKVIDRLLESIIEIGDDVTQVEY